MAWCFPRWTSRSRRSTRGWSSTTPTGRTSRWAGAPPAERFAARAADPGPALDLSALAERRVGDDWISRRVASNGVISVAWHQFSVGKHHSGEIVDVHVTDRLLEVWLGNELIKTAVRTSEGQVRKKRASKPAHPQQ